MLKRRSKHGPIGLDIGSGGVKLLQLTENDGKPAVLASACVHLREDNESTERTSSLRRAIASALRRAPFVGNEVVTTLDTSDLQMKNIRLPRMPEAELGAAVEFEARERFAFGETPVQIRYIDVGEVRHGNELKEEIIAFASTNEVVEARLNLLEELKLRPIALDIAPCAVARGFSRFLRRAEDAGNINVFIDIGFRWTSIIFTRGTELSFLKLIDMGGDRFNETVSKALSISRHEAFELRLQIMRESLGRRDEDAVTVPEQIQASVMDALRPSLERLARDVQLCLRYFAVTFRGQKPDSLTVVGGEAHEPALLRVLSDMLDVPCLVGHPLRGVENLGALVDHDKRTMLPAWAVASGLALRGSKWVRSAARRQKSMSEPQAAMAE